MAGGDWLTAGVAVGGGHHANPLMSKVFTKFPKFSSWPCMASPFAAASANGICCTHSCVSGGGYQCGWDSTVVAAALWVGQNCE